MKALYKQKWKPLLFCNGKYKISNHGNLMSVYTMSKTGEITMLNTIIKPHKNDKGYMKIDIRWSNEGVWKRKKMAVHRLVAMAFIPNPENKPEVNHLDFDTTNNHVNNLEWATSKENSAHYYASQKFKERKALRYTTFSKEDVLYIRAMFNKIPVKKLAEMYNVQYAVIYNMVTNITYNHDGEEKIRIGKPDYLQKVVSMFDLEGNELKKFPSLTSAANHVGTNRRNFKKQLDKSNRNYYKGYIWKYA